MSTTGLAITVFSVAYVVSAPFVGRLADRTDRRMVLLVASAVFALANLVTAIAPWFAVLILARIGAGLAAAGITPTIFALVGGAAVPARRAWALGIVTSGLLSALWLGAPLGELLSGLIGWRGVFLGLSVLTIVLLVVNRALWPTEPADRASTAAGGSPLWAKLGAVLPTTLWAVAVYGVYTYLASGLHGSEHWTSDAVATALACYGVCAVVSSVLGGRIADAWTARRTMIAALLGTGAALVLFGAVLSVGQLVTDGSLALFALGAYLVFPSQQAELLRRFAAQRSTVLAWNQSAMYVGIALGSGLGGLVVSRWGFGMLPYCCAVVAVLAAITTWRVHGGALAADRTRSTRLADNVHG